jgi:O-antigen/teichoic acid export membrane protein
VTGADAPSAALKRHAQAIIGVVGYGVGAYGFLVVAGRVLGPERFVNLSLLWTAVFTGVVGLLVPVEQEGARAVGMAVAVGSDIDMAVRDVRASATAVAALTSVLAVAASPVIASQLFDGRIGFVLVMAASFLAYGLLHGARAVLVGTAATGRFSALLLVDSVARLAITAVLLASGARSGLVLALAIPISPLVALLVAWPRGLSPVRAPSAWRPLLSRVAPIMAAALAAQLVVNFPAIAARTQAGRGEGAAIGSFVASLSLARAPLMLFGAFEAGMVPTLTAHAAHGRRAELRRVMVRYLTAVAGIGIACTLAGAIALGFALRVGFGRAYTFERRDVVMVLLGTGALLVLFVVGQGLLTLGRRRLLAVGWIVALLVQILAMVVVPGATPLRASTSYAAGSLAGALAGVGLLWQALRGDDADS